MILIYDFDGTLTPYSLPQYPILKFCGYDDNRITDTTRSYMRKYGIGFVEAYYEAFRNILAVGHIDMSRENICLGAQTNEFNSGVLEYFKRFQRKMTGIKHYIVTSGIKDYVDETPISEYVDGIYGITFHQSNGLFQEIDTLISAEGKKDIIEQIQMQNNRTNDIIYFGDGLTDRYAFEYVKSIGGKNVFVASGKQEREVYNELNTNGIIDECFEADFGENSSIRNFVQNVLVKQKTQRVI